MNEAVFSVSELNAHIRTIIDRDPLLAGLAVRGELSNYKIYPSGHHYFTLKDAESSLRCVMFRSQAQRLRFRPENGMQVLVAGRVTVYPRDGAYQLYAVSIRPEGAGDLQVAFEQLKRKLEEEGLFDPRHKKPLPPFPRRIAVITSSAGAAVHDIIRVLGKRWPMAEIVLLPVRVQGPEAPPEIVGAIRYADRWKVADVIITGRGGGSIEDLWAFNDERVARAIYACGLPVISAVGHEPDVTIADYVADRRAATPSNAAEIAVPDREEILAALRQREGRLRQAVAAKLSVLAGRLRDLAARPALTDPDVYLGTRKVALDYARASLAASAGDLLGGKRTGFASAAAKLDALSPLKVIARGYAVAEKDGIPLRSAADACAGDRLDVIMRDGTMGCLVKEIRYGREII